MSHITKILSRRVVAMFVACVMLLATIPATTVFANDEIHLAADLAWLNLGDTSDVRANLTLPATGPNGSVIAWDAGDSGHLFNDGTIFRPVFGDDVTVVLAAHLTNGDAHGTKDFTIILPGFLKEDREIENVRITPGGALISDHVIEVPQGSAPSLPFHVWVEYNDGHAEWRSTKWPWSTPYNTNPSNSPRMGPPALTGVWTPSLVDDMWKSYPVSHDYTINGWITGFGADHLGFPISVKATVLPVSEWRAKHVPSHEGKANQLPPGKVTLTGQNRLSSNALRSIARTVGYQPDTYLWNYRNVFGLPQPQGAVAPGGWEAPNVMLRGHGAGHYLSSMALAYASNLATPVQMTTLRNNMVYMINTMRDIQVMTIAEVPAEHPNSIENGGTGFREGSNVWPHYPADKATMAPDWPYPLLSEVNVSATATAPSRTYDNISGRYWTESEIREDGRPAPSTSPNSVTPTAGETFTMPSEKGNPAFFGYGYLNAVPPISPAKNEAYRGYSDWLWAPYYGWHKQMAGLMEVYYLFQDDSDPELKATAQKALQICVDMARWISDRLTKKAHVGPGTSTAYYGNMAYTWSTNISGEYGGANEAIARAAFELGDDDPMKDLLVRGSEMFYNLTYWEPLITNSEIMSRTGNSHANSRIPNFPGALWSYRGNGNPDYWLMAHNFLNFNQGRYRYFTGNVGTGEWYQTPYTQIERVNTNNVGMETCCAYNLMRTSVSLAAFDPDNPKYMDYYERLMFNQVVGSLSHRVVSGQAEWVTSYQYHLGANTTGGDWRGTTPGNDCCGGTGAENHVRYTDAIYLTNDNTVWVNMFIPSTLVYDQAGVTITQDGVWPAEYSKITVAQTPGETVKPFEMRIRVPWWVDKNFDIKINGEPFADSYAASSFVTIPDVKLTDVIEVFCPFQVSIDYGPDRRNNMWSGVFFYGPLSFTGGGDWSTVDVSSDLSNIEVEGPFNLADTAPNTPGTNNNLFRMSVTGQTNTNVNGMTPTYYRTPQRTGGTTYYFRINTITNDIDRDALHARITSARGLRTEDYTTGSLAALQTVIAVALVVYNDDESTQAQVNAQVPLIQAAVNALIASEAGKAPLLERINAAKDMIATQAAWDALPDSDPNKTFETKPHAPHAMARMTVQLALAEAVYADNEATYSDVVAILNALTEAMADVRPGYMPEVEDLVPLEALLATARAIPAINYTAESFAELQRVIAYVQEEIVQYIINGSSTIDQQYIPTGLRLAQEAIDALVVDSVPPPITAISPATAIIEAATAFSATTNTVGRTLTYAWSVTPSNGVVISNATAASASITFPELGQYTVSVVATDHWNRVSEFSRTVTVNARPVTGFNVGLSSRGTSLQSSYRNGTGSSGNVALPIDGTTTGRTAPNSLNTWNSNIRQFFQLTFADPVTVYAVNVAWLSDGGGTGAPRVQSNPTADTANQIKVPFDISNPVPGIQGGTSGNATNTTTVANVNWRTLPLFTRTGSAIANNQIGSVVTNPSSTIDWNFAGFEPVETRYLLMHLGPGNSNGGSNNGIGLNQWNTFALEPKNTGESVEFEVEEGITAEDFIAKFSKFETDMLMVDFATTTVNARGVINYADASYIELKSNIALRLPQTQVDAVAAGKTGETFTVTGTNPTLGYTLNINVTVTEAVIDRTEPYIAGIAAGHAPILPRRVVVNDLIFDTPTSNTVNNFQFGETFDQSLVPVVWDMDSFTAADYAAEQIGTSFTVTGVTAEGSRAPGLRAKAIFTVNEALAAPDYNHSITSENVIFDDVFWTPKQNVNATTTFDQAVAMLESTASSRGAVQNFKNSLTRLQSVWGGNMNPSRPTYFGYVFQDTDVYKTLEGFAYTLAANWDDPAFQSQKTDRLNKVKEWIDLIEAVQYADGYITTTFSTRSTTTSGGSGNTNSRWTYFARHEMYNIGHFLEAAVAYTRFSVGVGENDYTLYEVGRRAADHIVDFFGPGGKRVEVPGHQEIELALMKFAELYEEYEGKGAAQKYHDTVELLVDRRGRRTGVNARNSGYNGGSYSQDATPLVNETRAVGHAVRAMYYYTGATDIAIALPLSNPNKQAFLYGINNIYDTVSERNTYITGGLGSGETSEGFGPDWHIRNSSAYTETCAAIAGANWYQRLNLYHEDAQYADAYERALYNGVLVGITLQGNRFAYGTGIDSSTSRAEWQGCACCPPNVIRTIANASGYMYTVKQDNIFVNMYGGSTGHINVQGDDIVIRQETQYPWEGAIKMTVTPQADKKFTLHLRLPGWVKAQKYQQATLLIDGTPVNAIANEKGYIVIDRVWPEAGTVIDYTIPMEVRLTEGDNNVSRVYSDVGDRYSAEQGQWDKVVVERGPIVYMVEPSGVPNGAPATATTGRIAANVRLPRDMEDFEVINRLSGSDMLLRGVYTIEGFARYGSSDGPRDQWIQMVPYFTKTNRGGNPQNTANETSSTAAEIARVWINATENGVLIRGNMNMLEIGGTANLKANPKVNSSGFFEWASGTGDNTLYRPTGASLSYEWKILTGNDVIEMVGTPIAAKTDDRGPGKIGGLNYTFDASTVSFKALKAGSAKIEVTMKNNAGVVLATDTYHISVTIKAGLLAAIDEFKTLNENHFTSDSYAAAKAVYDAAVMIYEDDNATFAQVNAQADALWATIHAMVPTQSGKAALLALITRAEAMRSAQDTWEMQHGAAFRAVWDEFLADPGNDSLADAAKALAENRPYAPNGYARVLAQIAPARTLYANAGATLFQVNTAIAALENVIGSTRAGNMPEIEDLQPLNALISQAKGLNPDHYASGSLGALPAVIENVEGQVMHIMAGFSTIRVTDIPRAIKALRDAMDALVLLPTPFNAALRLPAHSPGTVLTTLQSNHQNGGSRNTPIDGTITQRSAPSTLNTWNNSAQRHWFQLTFADPVTVYAAQVMWANDGGGTQPPPIGTQVSDGTNAGYNVFQVPADLSHPQPLADGNTMSLALNNNWRTLELSNKDGSFLQQIGGRPFVNNTWHFARFEPVDTRYLLLQVNRASNGVGLNQWQAFVYEPVNKNETLNIKLIPGELTNAHDVFTMTEIETDMKYVDFASETGEYAYVKGGVALRALSNSAINNAVSDFNENGTVTITRTNPTLNYTLSINVAIAKTYAVTFMVDDGEYDNIEVKEGDIVMKPADPEKYGYTFRAWLLDGEDFDFSTSIIGDITLVASWDLNPITSLKISALSIETISRGETRQLSVILNEGAIDINVTWAIADTSLGFVDNDGTVTIFDKIGNVRLTATDPISGISHSITLRIAS